MQKTLQKNVAKKECPEFTHRKSFQELSTGRIKSNMHHQRFLAHGIFGCQIFQGNCENCFKTSFAIIHHTKIGNRDVNQEETLFPTCCRLLCTKFSNSKVQPPPQTIQTLRELVSAVNSFRCLFTARPIFLLHSITQQWKYFSGFD